MTSTASSPAPPTSAERRIFNFSAGPAVLPEPVLRQAQQDIWSIGGSGIGILEHSHRGAIFDTVLEEAIADCRAVGGIDDDYEILFLQGGATLQFAMIPMSFLAEDRTADYLDTGVWTNKAVKEAKLFGDVHLAFDGSTTSYDHVPSPDELDASADPAYTFYCSNNTIFGTQYGAMPPSAAPLVCDASSDIFSRPIDVASHAVVFAGAQKNLGPAGCSLVIIRKDQIERVTRSSLPTMLDYRKLADKGSRLNTPPAFAIYVIGRVFRWILDEGGLEAIDRRNREKADMVYDVIDAGDFYTGVARADSRSMMNITFRTPSDELDKAFIAEALANDMSGLKGHRSAGGLRASIYNAFPRAGCETLAAFMRDFASRNG